MKNKKFKIIVIFDGNQERREEVKIHFGNPTKECPEYKNRSATTMMKTMRQICRN